MWPRRSRAPLGCRSHPHGLFRRGISLTDTAAAARAAQLDFIVITDHNTLGAREHEGYIDDVLVVVDVEVSPSPVRNHVIALGLPEYDAGLDAETEPERVLEAIEERGGTCWVPHPFGFRNRWCRLKNDPWQVWNPRVRGIELGSYLVRWVESVRPWNLLRRMRRPEEVPAGPDPRALQLWDTLNARPDGPLVSGFLGLDAHYLHKFGGRVHSPRYETLFGTHVLQAWTPPPTGNATTDVDALRAALCGGHFASEIATVDARGALRFGGGTLPDGSVAPLALEAPDRRETRVRLLRDGKPFQEIHGSGVQIDEPPIGVYRAEIFRGGQLWALTNPIRVADPVAADRATNRADSTAGEKAAPAAG